MNITPVTRQITDFSFRLSSEDLERYLADPQAWAADVRAQLNGQVTSGGHPVGAGPNGNGGGRGPKGAAGAPAHARRQPQRRSTSSATAASAAWVCRCATAGTAKTVELAPMQCPFCRADVPDLEI